MARTPLVAGNWKMNTTLASAGELVREIVAGAAEAGGGVEQLVCPPYPFLALAAEAARGSPVRVGAQDLYWEEKGAFTGAVSGPMLADLVEYVIIGHSERRALFGDTDEAVQKKLVAALAAGLKPIVCVGETGEEREAGRTEAVLQRQVRGAFAGVDAPPTTVVAYEPVWAIGTGRAATAADAEAATRLVRTELAGLLGPAKAEEIRVLYGGSVSPDNIADFVGQPDVDGGLVGGASLVADSFLRMVRSVAALPNR